MINSDATANSRASVYFHATIVCPPRNFENSHPLSNSTELQTKDIARKTAQQWKQGYKSCENPVPICMSQDAKMECVVTSHAKEWAVWDKSISLLYLGITVFGLLI